LGPYGPVVPVSITMTNGDLAAPADPDPDETGLLLQAASTTASTASAARSSRGERLARFLTWPMWDPPLPPRHRGSLVTENTSADRANPVPDAMMNRPIGRSRPYVRRHYKEFGPKASYLI
jgi:hypothetical protein